MRVGEIVKASREYPARDASPVVSELSVMMMLHPFPLVMHSPILLAIRAFPSPVLVMSDPAALVPLVPLVVPLFRVHPVMVFREGVASIDTLLAVVADARAIVGMPTLG